jgi:predicted homoserine dehydrogenase-like protein
MSNPNGLTRRRFLKTATVVGAVCAAPTVVPASALGAEGRAAPSERIHVGMIGLGRQAKFYNIRQFLEMPEVQVVAVCDVDSWRLANGRRQVEEAYATKSPSGRTSMRS